MSHVEIHLVADDGNRMVIAGLPIRLRGDGQFRTIAQIMDRLRVCAEIGDGMVLNVDVPPEAMQKATRQ